MTLTSIPVPSSSCQLTQYQLRFEDKVYPKTELSSVCFEMTRQVTKKNYQLR
jgi:hypothetical protein